MTETGKLLMADLVGENGDAAQEEALLETMQLMVRREFAERRVTATGDVHSFNLDGENFVFTL